MTNGIDREEDKCILRVLIISLVLSVLLITQLATSGELVSNNPGAQAVKLNGKTFWSVIEALQRQIPFTREKIDAVLETRLDNSVVPPLSGDYARRPLQLEDGVTIGIINMGFSGLGFLALKVDGPCITLKEARSHYDKLKDFPPFSVHAPTDEIPAAVSQDWGQLMFRFKKVEPAGECLKSVAFHPKEPPEVRPVLSEMAFLATLGGSCQSLERYVERSPILRRQIKTLMDTGWSLQFGPGSLHHNSKLCKTIVIARVSQGLDWILLSELAHELGYATSGLEADTRSKEAYVARALLDEGRAEINRMAIRQELGMKTSLRDDSHSRRENWSTYDSIFIRYQQDGDLDKASREIGDIYADREIERFTGKTYRRYYEDEYDRLYGNNKTTTGRVDPCQPFPRLTFLDDFGRAAQNVEQSPTWWWQTKALQEAGWRIEHGPARRHHEVKTDKRIVIDEWWDREKSDYSEELRDTFNRSYQKDAIIHETGHAVSDVKIDTRSKEVFVATALLDEGAAMLNYMIIQTEIRGVGMLESSGVNFENKPDYKAIFKQYQQDGNADKARRAIAAIYADREIEPSTGKTYRQYYEDRYDGKHSSKRGGNVKQTGGPGRKKVR